MTLTWLNLTWIWMLGYAAGILVVIIAAFLIPPGRTDADRYSDFR